eukprot:NODE_2627_length_531_cov_72.759901_g2577_i0.p1 GENE.NODE_2627_length_531_cov_72.759901_g2577_i0~~NODE_2627_length_531_cov_72.759901_g2577_i0.p1  ORF type:complete len:136 (+),score=13.09 NODE_2627_length_531_cov_72.759901_g2577_i0:83-490(+)
MWSALSFTEIAVLALLTGFGALFVILGCALTASWWPFFSLLTFSLSALPFSLCVNPQEQLDYVLSDGDESVTMSEMGKFLTGFFSTSGLAMIVVAVRAHEVAFGGLVWTYVGIGTLVGAFGYFMWVGRSRSVELN